MRHIWIIGATVLAACASGEQVNESGTDEANVAEPMPVGNAASDGANNQATSEPQIGGPPQWFTRTRDGEQWAGYGPPFSETVFSVRCNSSERQLIFNTMAMPKAGAGSTTMQFSAEGVDQTLTAEASEEGLPSTEATVQANSQWLTRLAEASGDLTVRVGESDPVTVPLSEQLASLIRNCRG